VKYTAFEACLGRLVVACREHIEYGEWSAVHSQRGDDWLDSVSVRQWLLGSGRGFVNGSVVAGRYLPFTSEENVCVDEVSAQDGSTVMREEELLLLIEDELRLHELFADLEYHLEDLRLSLLVSLSGFSPQLRLATREAYGKG
jgi:hypothetical protein